MGRRLIRRGTILVVLGAMAAGILSLLDKEVEWRAGEAEPPGNVKTGSVESDLPCFTVKPGKFTITVATGVVEPARTEDVMCPVEGTAVIVSMLPEGTLVQKGQLVCELDPSRSSGRPAGARIAATEEDDAAKLRQPIERYKLYAPADGTLLWGGDRSRFVEGNPIKLGATVWKGHCIFQLYDLSGPMRVRTSVLEEVIGYIGPGMPARIRLDAFPRELFTGSVRKIYPLPFGTFHSQILKLYDTLVSVDGGPPGPRPGMRTHVEILVNDGDNVLSLPRTAVLSFYGKDLAAVKRSDGGFDWREITLGARTESLAEVQRGLQSGDCVCLKPYPLMRAQENAKRPGLPSRPASRGPAKINNDPPQGQGNRHAPRDDPSRGA